MSGIVIIGAGECGVRAAFAARAEGFDGEVTLVGDECGMPYERPPLSKPDANGATLKPICTAEMLAAKNIMLLDGVAAKHINREASCVRLSTGEDLTYSRLLLATGASPRRLTCEGGEHAVTLRTIEDANRIYSAAVKRTRTVIIGAGLIGLELAAELVGRGSKITVLEAGPVPLGRNVPQPLAQRIVERHLAEGVDIVCNVEVARISSRAVELVGGQLIAADLVVAAIGVVPNTDLAQAAGLYIGNGIAVDEALRTIDTNIFAAGDCASVNFSGLGLQRFETWQNAQFQGEIAGRNLAGASGVFQPPVWFWSDQYDLGLQGVGQTIGKATVQRTLSDDAKILFYLNDAGQLVGAAGLGVGNAVAKDIKLAQKLIEAKVAVAAASLEDPTTNLKKLLKPAPAN
jgi:3-phenylpropionate/trans-cinnamate dioxygenase ferredoxin reductase subunit